MIRRKKLAKLNFDVSDNSGKATVTAGVFRGARLVKNLGSEEVENGGYFVRWRAPAAPTRLSFCVVAQDAVGNVSKRSCAAIRVT